MGANLIDIKHVSRSRQSDSSALSCVLQLQFETRVHGDNTTGVVRVMRVAKARLAHHALEILLLRKLPDAFDQVLVRVAVVRHHLADLDDWIDDLAQLVGDSEAASTATEICKGKFSKGISEGGPQPV